MAEKDGDDMGCQLHQQDFENKHELYGPELERQLVLQFEAHLLLELRFTKRNFVIKKEVGAGRGIADVVLFTLPDNPSNIYSSSLSAFESTIVSVIKKRGEMTSEDFLGWLGLRNFSDPKIKRLIRSGIVESRDEKLFIRTERPPLKIIAYEAKLKDWQSALGQAYDYYGYADESFVVLPEGSSAIAINNLNMFKDRGVGLIVVSHSGYTQVVGAESPREHDWRREFVYSRALAGKI